MTETAPGHACRQSENPRNKGFCACGKRMREPVRRVLELEREATEEAAKGAAYVAELILHSETRANSLSSKYVPDSMLIRPGRDRARDVREEIADARNHIVFHLQEHPEDPRNERFLQGLRYLALAYNFFEDDL